MFDYSAMKPLKEVIPGLMTAQAILDRADRIYIEKMLMPRSRDRLRIFLHAPFLIEKRDIWALEAAIKKQHFRNKDVKVEIIEHFHPEEMSLQEAYDAYRDSIFLELKSSRLYEYNLMRKASLDFSKGEVVMLELPDLSVLAARGKALAEYLKSVFQERLGFPVSIRLKTGAYQKIQRQDEASEEALILSILDQSIQAEKSEEQKAEKKTEARSFTPKRARLDEASGWGRDFEGEPLPLSEIVSEMGEVTVQGEVLSLEKRELKNGNTLYSFVLTDYTDSIKAKIFGKPQEEEQLKRLLAPGSFLRLKGWCSSTNMTKKCRFPR